MPHLRELSLRLEGGVEVVQLPLQLLTLDLYLSDCKHGQQAIDATSKLQRLTCLSLMEQ